jgi:hypothetical protein
MPQMPKLTDEQIQHNMQVVARAVAQQEMEGLQVSPEARADMYRVARGEIDTAEVLRNIEDRLRKNVPLRRK